MAINGPAIVKYRRPFDRTDLPSFLVILSELTTDQWQCEVYNRADISTVLFTSAIGVEQQAFREAREFMDPYLSGTLSL